MRKKYFRRSLRTAAVVVSFALPVGLVSMPATSVAAEQVKRPPDRCAGMTPPSDDENHASIRLDHPQQGEELAVDEQGKIDLAGVLHKHASMVDVSVGDLVTTD